MVLVEGNEGGASTEPDVVDGQIEDLNDNDNDNESKRSSLMWRCLGGRVPREEVVYVSQMIVIFTVVATSVYNLSRSTEQSELWTALLSSCLGYILPNPRLRGQRG